MPEICARCRLRIHKLPLRSMFGRYHNLEYCRLTRRGEARSSAPESGSPCQYRVARSDRLPVPDGMLDGMSAKVYLHHAPDPPAAIKEMARVLKPDGMVCLAYLDPHADTWQRRAGHRGGGVHHQLWGGVRGRERPIGRSAGDDWPGECGLLAAEARLRCDRRELAQPTPGPGMTGADFLVCRTASIQGTGTSGLRIKKPCLRA
jgi:SAM-dependent methyltransferase